MLGRFTRVDSLPERVGPVLGESELSGREQVCDGASSSAPGAAGLGRLVWAT